MRVLFLLVVALVLSSCSENTSVKDNFLLPNNTNVSYLVEIDSSNTDYWQKGFNANKFINILANNVFNNVWSINSPYANDTITGKLSLSFPDDIFLKKPNENNPYSWGSYWLSTLSFNEDWDVDNSSFQIIKNIVWWNPVFFNAEDSLNNVSLFKIYGGKKDKKIAENIIYEISFNPIVSPVNNFRFIDSERFFKKLFNSVFSGSINAYDPMDENRVFTANEICIRMGLADSVKSEDINYYELQGIIFIEDWFINEKTGELAKEVLGYAPVRYYKDINNKLNKSIPFVVYFTNNRISVLG